MGSRSDQIQIDVVADAVGADIVQRRINHPGAQRIDLDVSGPEVMLVCTRQGNVQSPLSEIVANAASVVISECHTRHPREHFSPLDFAKALEIDASRCELVAVEYREKVRDGTCPFRSNHRHLKLSIAGTPQKAVGDSPGR